MERFDKVIFGAGFYGLYSALFCGKLHQRVLVIEKDAGPFCRASFINQARVHMGYHYPRSISTAMKSAGYFDRFCRDYGFCINGDFDQVYATSSCFSWTSANDFALFCRSAGIPCTRIDGDRFFRPGMCDGAFLTKEFTYDAQTLKNWLLNEIIKWPNIEVAYCHSPERIAKGGDIWEVTAQDIRVITPFILNATYASVNDVLKAADCESSPFQLKYEKCEIILCSVNDALRKTGITVMDGPFFSLMPFGKTGLHSLTSVTFTPHEISYESTPVFSCQGKSGGKCGLGNLYNCNDCPARPESAWVYMSQLARKYLKDEFAFRYDRSLYSMKPILTASEIDDSRPTVIHVNATSPTMVSVLSGKINTVYDLDDLLKDETMAVPNRTEERRSGTA